MGIDEMQYIPSYEQMETQNRILERIATAQQTSAGTSDGMSSLERMISTEFNLRRTGKVYRTRFYKYNTNHTSIGTKLDDNANLKCVPSTDTSQGQDDYANIPSFAWMHCNYTRDASDGFARPIALEGMQGYHEIGAYDVGTLHPTFYWGVDKHDTYYDVIYSDTPHLELGLVPWKDAVKIDASGNRTVMSYWVQSSFYSANASDGLLRSQPNLPSAYNQSYNNMITNYQKKGVGYWGAGISRNLYAILMFAIKYGTKNSQSIMKGCSDYNTQVKCALGESGTKRVLLSSQGAFIKGGCVSIGVANDTSTDRQNAKMNSIADRVVVKSIENVTVNGTKYIALNLDIPSTITTTTDTYVSAMPQYTGTTNAVIGHHDGSVESYTDGKHTFRIQGQEYMDGHAIICSDVVIEFLADHSKNVYIAPNGVKHVADSHSGYDLVGNIPNNGNGADYYSGDVDFDLSHGAYWPSSIGGGDSIGTGDMVWAGGAQTGGLREWFSLGYMGYGSLAGLCAVGCWNGLGYAHWHYGSCD